MISCKVDDTVYVVRFEHNNKDSKRFKGNPPEKSTVRCAISDVDNKQFLLVTLPVEYPVYNRARERKRAFRTAVEMMFPGTENKRVRRQLWQSFFSAVKKW
jgi:hypothetical protein